ncbi:MAG: hypothetical protein V1906_00290 [Candidatus Woesearchaeota archaeon]
MQKKISALLIMAMFIVSMVPFALAERPAETGRDRFLEASESSEDDEIEIEGIEDIMNEPEAKRVGLCVEKVRKNFPKVLPEKAQAVCDKEFKGKMLGLNKEFREKFKEKAKEYRAFKENHGKRMEIAKEKLEKAKEKFAMAKEKYNKAKENLEKSKNKFEDAKNLYKVCNTNATSEECVKAKEDIKESWREKLLNTADIMVEHFQKMKSKVESNDRLTEEEQNKTLAWIDAKITEANAIKLEIQNAKTKDELMTAAKKLQDLWAKSKVKAKGYAGRVVTDKFAGILQQSKQLEVKLDRVLEKMEANGKNVTEVNGLVDKFHAEIADAETHFKAAKAKFQGMENATESDVHSDYETLKGEAHAEITEAKKSLDSARDTLRQILEKVKAENGTEELASTTDEEVEDDAEAASA